MDNSFQSIEERKKQFQQTYEGESEGAPIATPKPTKSPELIAAEKKQQINAAKAAANKKKPTSEKRAPEGWKAAEERRHSHPMQSTQPSVRSEKAFVESTATTKNAEGCVEHYDIRFVKVNENTPEERELTTLEKIMAYGDCLLYPKYKEY